ncbi:MAG TPA: hypothetical protein PL078_05200 [Bacillota bacterium]|jgi:hypothetical protein|nr:hypothetical protein [Peptococcaceae bacterium MAG4]NLW38995.1 hypothetical protein [Peptococcaceae bacterium]HPZ43381.1 hypothetical protein [Bacillota bacterium]HQD76385.1 hypothetical protein [Bacillota bacterium]HUM58922.1 hypothetical protein [Bacillota bacterium]
MLDKKEYVQIEVGGKHYLCSIWYRSKDILWYGKRLESEISNLCYAVSREGLLKKIRMQIAAANK